ncbi:hypothetical protein AT1219_60191 [Vibrio alginolyticus]
MITSHISAAWFSRAFIKTSWIRTAVKLLAMHRILRSLLSNCASIFICENDNRQLIIARFNYGVGECH